MSYEPMPVEVHLERGYCCEAMPQCKNCPYHGARQAPTETKKRAPLVTTSLLAELMKKAALGEKVVYNSSYHGNKKSITLCGDNLTIIYGEGESIAS